MMRWSAVLPLKVALLDDHALIREALSVRLLSEPDIKVVGMYSRGSQLPQFLREEPVDVLILDYQLSDGELDGLRLIQLLRGHYPSLRILILSSVERPATVNMTIRAGANGFFGKSQSTEDLAPAIRTVARNRLYLSPTMEAELDSRPETSAAVSLDGANTSLETDQLIDYPALSPKEREVLRCCLDGMSVSQIAIKFLRSRKTISGQKQAAFRKLNVRTDTEFFKLHLHLKDL